MKVYLTNLWDMSVPWNRHGQWKGVRSTDIMRTNRGNIFFELSRSHTTVVLIITLSCSFMISGKASSFPINFSILLQSFASSKKTSSLDRGAVQGSLTNILKQNMFSSNKCSRNHTLFLQYLYLLPSRPPSTH